MPDETPPDAGGPNSAKDLLIRSDRLEVAVSAEFGGGITGARHLSSGADLLWRTPWAQRTPQPPPDEPLDVDAWVRHSRGGWQVLLPNGGDACQWRGRRHGFHGEASVITWRVTQRSDASVTLAASLATAPIDVLRTVAVVNAELVVHERLTNRSAQPVEFIWTHHPGFGPDLLDGGARLDTNAGAVRLDDRAPVVGIAATPGDAGRWPRLAAVGPGEVDLRYPVEGSALLAYLSDFDGAAWVSLVRGDATLGVRLSWDAATFPHCWLWQELGGTTGAPWHGQVRVIGIEPSTSWPGQGLVRVAERTGTTHRLAGQEAISTSVTLSVFTAADTHSVAGESP